MKIVAAILATAIVSASVTFLVTGKTKTVEVERIVEAKTDDKDKIIAALKKERDEAKAATGRVEVVETGVAIPGVVTEPSDLIDKLMADKATGADPESQRRVIHYFESLVDAGNAAVPAINAFLDQHKEREFGQPTFRQRLQITNTQMEEIRALSEKTRASFFENMREMRELPESERREKFQAFFAGIQENYTALMTEEQKAQLSEMGDDGTRNLIRTFIFSGGGPGGFGRDRGGRR